jgi:isopenicillin-N N-acyltransferase-like protein
VFIGGFNCSSLIVEPDRSATKGPLFGRNLDYFTLDVLDRYSLVTVCRPEGKHAFASIGFPGLFGCLSGMNDAGLALATHQVYGSLDASPRFNPKGMPYTFCFRQILEQCTTVEEAERLLRSAERTTFFNLAICDRRGGAVFEATPKTLAVRRAEAGICACTNHFRTAELLLFPFCRRYDKLMESKSLRRLAVADVAQKLDEVNQGSLTVQTMIFEPATLKLHLAIGKCPSSSQPMKELDLKRLFDATAATDGFRSDSQAPTLQVPQ